MIICAKKMNFPIVKRLVKNASFREIDDFDYFL